VENAFVHGLERKIGQGCICIRIIEDDAFLRISVEDDGMGIEQETLTQLQMRLAKDQLSKNGSIGLTNVNQRTKLYYGEQYHLHVESTLHQGTKVSIELPLRKGENLCIES
ncbi:MAG: two-component sensor histidine kinase, partial [Vallitaleaceae bacterium]|nr:two-component sensor histidine kinase [Vallitaleaceae bacterium]